MKEYELYEIVDTVTYKNVVLSGCEFNTLSEAQAYTSERRIMKSFIVAALISAIISSGGVFTADNTSAMTGKVLNKYTEAGIKYTAFQTSDGNMWIVKGSKYWRNAKYIIVFDNHGTEDITDDSIVRIIKR